MAKLIETPTKKIDDYSQIIGEETIERIKEKSEKLKDKEIIHINSTSYGGGVAEILRNLVSLLNDLNIKNEWFVLEGSDIFFNVTKKIHNALQGNKEIRLTEEMIEIYLKNNKKNLENLDLDKDFIIVHDPHSRIHTKKFRF